MYSLGRRGIDEGTSSWRVRRALISCGRPGADPKAATYITAEQVKQVNALPGVDRQIVKSMSATRTSRSASFIVGKPVSHRRAPEAGAARVEPPPRTRRTPEPCGEKGTVPPGSPTGLWHQGQTETYLIISGSGTLVTGGKVVNGRKSSPTSEVTKVLNGPSCSGGIVGDDVVQKVVNVGDIIIIPAGVPHGWANIPDHVDYLSVRPIRSARFPSSTRIRR